MKATCALLQKDREQLIDHNAALAERVESLTASLARAEEEGRRWQGDAAAAQEVGPAGLGFAGGRAGCAMRPSESCRRAAGAGNRPHLTPLPAPWLPAALRGGGGRAARGRGRGALAAAGRGAAGGRGGAAGCRAGGGGAEQEGAAPRGGPGGGAEQRATACGSRQALTAGWQVLCAALVDLTTCKLPRPPSAAAAERPAAGAARNDRHAGAGGEPGGAAAPGAGGAGGGGGGALPGAARSRKQTGL